MDPPAVCKYSHVDPWVSLLQLVIGVSARGGVGAYLKVVAGVLLLVERGILEGRAVEVVARGHQRLPTLGHQPLADVGAALSGGQVQGRALLAVSALSPRVELVQLVVRVSVLCEICGSCGTERVAVRLSPGRNRRE
jgi:hypothetical protein